MKQKSLLGSLDTLQQPSHLYRDRSHDSNKRHQANEVQGMAAAARTNSRMPEVAATKSSLQLHRLSPAARTA